MRPALRSDTSALCLASLLALILLLPVLLLWGGLPPRSEAYKSMSTASATVGTVIQAIYQSPPEGDIVFLGSSLVSAGISQSTVSLALSEHLHRDVSVQVLAVNWPGLDVQYFMLRDYLNAHKAHLLVWNLPEPHSRAYEYPQIQAYRWMRFGEYSDALRGLPINYRLALYGEAVIGAPRQFLSVLRPNLIRDEGTAIDPKLARSGYLGAQFIQDNSLPKSPANEAMLVSLNSPDIAVKGPAPGPYQMHFAKLIVKLAKQHNCRVVLLHIPLDAEFNDTSIPELSDWRAELGPDLTMIGAPASRLFSGMDHSHFDRFYRDAHLNENGTHYFTQAILPALLHSYNESPSR